jgi:hypothetical protein
MRKAALTVLRCKIALARNMPLVAEYSATRRERLSETLGTVTRGHLKLVAGCRTPTQNRRSPFGKGRPALEPPLDADSRR